MPSPSSQPIPNAAAKKLSRKSPAALMAWFGLAAGPIAFLLCLNLLPETYVVSTETGGQQVPFTWAGRATLAAMLWLGIWWLTEAVEISVTALLPIVLFPLCGIASITATCYPYADPLVFLYLAGFVLAMAMERWGLGRRLALWTLSRVGMSTTGMIGGVMLVTAILSAFVSNTATTAMMLPIGLSIIQLLRQQAGETDREGSEAGASSSSSAISSFGVCLLLSIAYSASIGGMMTIIGTPTNAFLVGFLKDKIASDYRLELTFVSWLPLGVPLVILLLPLVFLILTRLLFPIRSLKLAGGTELILKELKSLGSIRQGEWNVAGVFALVVFFWLTRPLWNALEMEWEGQWVRPLGELSDTGIAMAGAFTLFLIPVNARRREFTMNWSAVESLPWGILLLFGGGLSLAAAVANNGVAEFIGSRVESLGGIPPWLMVLAVTLAIIFLTELTSNAATTASLVPVLAAISPGLGIHPYLLIFPATLAASCAFMLPVATPPNAIVFGSGAISTAQMARAGFVLNLVGSLVIVSLALWLVPWWFIPG
jgi:solute carrier family 13 (sodium-dependent dicarboxylate transporter), member 2/3/5